MSLLSGGVGQALQGAVGGFLGHVFGTNNRSALGDCQASVGLIGLGATLQKYPQCVPLLSGGTGVVPVSPAVPVAPVAQVPQLPAPVPGQVGGFQNAAYVTNASLSTALAPVLKAMPGSGAVVSALGSAARAVAPYAGTAARLLQRYPTAAGIIGGFLVDAAGQWILSPHGKRVSVKRRRINPLNVRALNRAIRRVHSAKKICSRVDKLVGHHRRRAPPVGCKKRCR